MCSELAGAADTEYKATYPEGPTSRFLADTHSTAAMVDMSPLMLGHVLIVPRRHYLSVAETMAQLDVGFLEFMQEFLEKYRTIFGCVSLVEHGSTKEMNRSACISHAHLHVVPIEPAQILTEMQDDGLEFGEPFDWSTLPVIADHERPYYLVANEERVQVALHPKQMRSQYFRTVLGRILDIPREETDYSVVVRRDLLRATIDSWNRGNVYQDSMQSTG
jgi:diadenosine tetraphosphate (Ap4A) HIT family hydrolase